MELEEILARANGLASPYGLAAEFLGDSGDGDGQAFLPILVLVGPHPGSYFWTQLRARLINALPISRARLEWTLQSLKEKGRCAAEAAALATIRFPCPFCDRMHTGEFWDEVDEQVMACRDRVSPRKRGDLAAYDPEEFNLYTITTESLIPR